MSTAVVEKQHYIPKLYLKLFENNNRLIERLDVKENRVMKPVGKAGLCNESFFYALNTGVKDIASQSLEGWFRKIEDNLGKRLANIISKVIGNDKVEDNDKYDMAVLMTMMYLRGPIFRQMLNNMMLSGLEQEREILANFPKEKTNDFFKERYSKNFTSDELKKLLEDDKYIPQFNNLQHIFMMKELRGFSNLLFGQEWLIYRNNSTIPFITSDNPLSSERIEKRSFFWRRFYGLHISFCFIARNTYFVKTS